MKIKTELIALGIRLLAENTSLIRKPEGLEAALLQLFNGDSYDKQMARNVERELDKVTDAAKKIHQNRSSVKKITDL